MEKIIQLCLHKIQEYQDPGPYLTWARDVIPDALGEDWRDLPPPEARRLSFLLARAVWNATPLPAEGFRIRTLHDPPSGDPCPCGSGSRFGSCCGQVEDVPDLPAEIIWELLLLDLDEGQLPCALESGQVPPHLLGLAAERFLSADRPGRAAGLLEPLFATGAESRLDERFDHALNVLCDVYDRRGHYKKKASFLERMSGHACRALRAAAWQRLCTIQIDEGDFTAAQIAFSRAQREGPDNPGTALLEITLLASQYEDELARSRAVFWLHKLRRSGAADEEILGFLAAAARDPQDALMTSQSEIIDPRLMLLRVWVRDTRDRPLPAYGLKPGRRKIPAAERQLSLFGEQDASAAWVRTPEAPEPARLCPSAGIQCLEGSWHRLIGCPKPPSTSLLPSGSWDPWDGDDWLDFLVRHPEAADSLDILDDLVTALYLHPESALTWISRSLLTPLLERAGRIIERVLPERSRRTIPWSSEENRAALRLLFRLYLARMDEDRESQAMETLCTLLRLNPTDNHGVRAELMNHYLRRHENDKALDLAERFPDDLLVELAYGEVLALYRMGARNQARHALRRALVRLPRIPRFLTRKRVPRLRDTDLDAPLEADDEALLYREAMLDVWEAEPGLLDWLKKNARQGSGNGSRE
jgi:tetratricopeptide (TPR) repeat protein